MQNYPIKQEAVLADRTNFITNIPAKEEAKEVKMPDVPFYKNAKISDLVDYYRR